MRHFGIIGKPLEHSFSARYFTTKFARDGVEADYRLFPLDTIADFPKLIQREQLAGLNVTYPYKERLMPYLDRLDKTAAEIGAVNVIAWENGAIVGYNTDTVGFEHSLRKALRGIASSSLSALVLGTGGAAKAVGYALKRMRIPYQNVSRDAKKGITYDILTQEVIGRNRLIVNCTPLGMYPAIDAYPPLPFEAITEKHILYDLIYNPAETLFLRQGKAQGARTMNGMEMLLGQAEAAWKIWERASC